ncbi:MAG: hemolysin family protein [Candidatus Glassbacteria bacterium]
MLLSSLILAVIFICCLILSAVFSGSETAFFSLSKWQISKMEEDGRKHVRTVEKLLERSDDLLNGILLGNLLVSIAAASSATFLTHNLFMERLLLSESSIYLIDILLITAMILLFGEISPKVYAVDNPERFSSRVAPFLSAWVLMIKPFIRILSFMTGAAKKIFRPSARMPRFTEEELLTTVSTTIEDDSVDKAMIQKIFTFGDTMVKEIMVPRTNMLCIEEDTLVEETCRMVKEIEHSRIPLYRENLDNITGILYSKDLLAHAFGFSEIKSIEEIKKPAHFVPEFKKVNDLLREFQLMKVHMAIVVDEYGGTAGLVTLEDVIEEIVGEIQDEYDVEEPQIIQIRDGVYLVDGLMDIDDFQEILGVEIEGEGFETLGGYIFSLMGKIPKQGDEIARDSLVFRIYRVAGKRVSKVIVRKVVSEITENDADKNGGE